MGEGVRNTDLNAGHGDISIFRFGIAGVLAV
jgi:hypothetical protein